MIVHRQRMSRSNHAKRKRYRTIIPTHLLFNSRLELRGCAVSIQVSTCTCLELLSSHLSLLVITHQTYVATLPLAPTIHPSLKLLPQEPISMGPFCSSTALKIHRSVLFAAFYTPGIGIRCFQICPRLRGGC
jgi:hypothetical protein